jgi:mono/diheme cytochrome c family protein
MIISTLFLLTGILLLIEKPIIGKFLIFKWITLLAAIPMAIIAFKKNNKILAVLSYFLLIMTYGFAEMNAKRPVSKEITGYVVTDPNTPGYDVIRHGKAVYDANCVMCHGEDGKKGLAGAKDLSISSLNDNEKITVIMNGKGAMSPYKKVLSEEDIKAVVQYINTFKQ